MAVLTFGDILAQCRKIAGIRDTETDAVSVLEAAINTAHTKVVKAAIAEGFPYMLKLGIGLSVAATDTRVVLPDGVTVLDTTGVIAPKCVQVVSVKLASTYARLTYYSRELFEAQCGRLEDTQRSVPQYFDPYGVDTTGRRLLWLMPMPASADTVYVDYIGGLTYLTNHNQALLVPEDDRELVAQEAIACCNARDSIDGALVQKALQDAAFLWRCFYATADGYRAQHPAIRQVFGHIR